jgi:hypothetical protein
MKKQNSLEIYQPGSTKEVLASYETSCPLPSIATGEFLNLEPHPGVARVTAIEHLVWEYRGELRHKLMVYSELVPSPDKHRLSSR